MTRDDLRFVPAAITEAAERLGVSLTAKRADAIADHLRRNLLMDPIAGTFAVFWKGETLTPLAYIAKHIETGAR